MEILNYLSRVNFRDVIIRKEGEGRDEQTVEILWRVVIAAVSCRRSRTKKKPTEKGFRQRGRENGGVVGHWQGEIEGDGWRRGRERTTVPNEGSWGRRRCARQIEHPRRDNIITGRVLWGVRAHWYGTICVLRHDGARNAIPIRAARDSILPVWKKKKERDIVPASSDGL